MGPLTEGAAMVEPNCSLKVACIVPVFNVEKYLVQCVESLLKQSYPLYEILLIDDGSTDRSGVICDALCNEHRRIRCIHKNNEGLGYARNTGIDSLSADSQFVMFVDSDDWLELDAVERLVAALEDMRTECVLGGHTKKDGGNRTQFVLQLENASYDRDGIASLLIPRLCGSSPSESDSLPMSVCGCLFSTDVIRRGKLLFPSERQVISEDFVFKFNYLLASDTASTSDFVQYCYRTNPNSLTTSYRADRFEANYVFYDTTRRMIEDAGLEEECLVRLQKTFLILLRMALSQEALTSNGKSPSEARAAIKGMCQDSRVRHILDSYPIQDLGWRQRLFCQLVGRARANLLYVLAKCDVL